ncbi:MAG: hypothetical protein IKQ91_10365 [Oscillospiraceae bacterium]|nr:hypothetical protein [Oscillospiraceae bacterium]
MKANVKTVRRNLSKLMEADFPIRYQGSTMDSHEIKRKGRNGKEQTILTNWNVFQKWLDPQWIIEEELAEETESAAVRKKLDHSCTVRCCSTISAKCERNPYAIKSRRCVSCTTAALFCYFRR